MTDSTTRRIGPRMRALCQILARMGGSAPSQSDAYMRLAYPGGASNYYGSQAMYRAMRAGLIRPGETTAGNRIPVTLTPLGRRVAEGDV